MLLLVKSREEQEWDSDARTAFTADTLTIRVESPNGDWSLVIATEGASDASGDLTAPLFLEDTSRAAI